MDRRALAIGAALLAASAAGGWLMGSLAGSTYVVVAGSATSRLQEGAGDRPGTETTVAGFRFRTDAQEMRVVWDAGMVFVRTTTGSASGTVRAYSVQAGEVSLNGTDQVELVWNPDLPDTLVPITTGSWTDSDDDLVLMSRWNRTRGLDTILGDPQYDQSEPT